MSFDRIPTVASVIYAGTTTGLYKSLNGGAAWKTLTSTQANSMAFDPPIRRSFTWRLQYEGIGKSENGGEHITPVNHGFVDRVISAITVSGQKLLAIETQEGESTGIFSSSDHGESWVQAPPTRTLGGVHLKAVVGLPDTDRFLLAASARQMYKSVDGGVIWKALPVRLVIPPPPVEEPAKKPVPARACSHPCYPVGKFDTIESCRAPASSRSPSSRKFLFRTSAASMPWAPGRKQSSSRPQI